MSVIALFVMFPVLSHASPGTGKAYTYDHNNKAMAVPDPYETDRVINLGEFGIQKPADVVFSGELIYILGGDDASKIIVLNTDFTLNRIIGFSKDGAPYKTQEPRGMWVKNGGTLLVADRGRKLVFAADADGAVTGEFGKPASEMYGGGDFLPLKVLTDRLGRVYVLSEGEYRGIVRLSKDGEFLNFYGAKRVEITAAVLLDTMWSNFMTDAQQEGTKRHLPVEYAWITSDDSGFVYTVSGSASAREDTLTKLNSSGKNVLGGSKRYGDYNLGNYMGTWYKTGFTSLCVDGEGFITTLDKTWNRLFQYSEEGELLYIFGGKDGLSGTFGEVGTIASVNECILVSDILHNTVTVFKPTSFGLSVRQGSKLFESGLFKESIEPWREALSRCGNYEPAYVGIGKALHADKQYAEAMKYFEMGHSQSDYSLSYSRERAAMMRGAFAPFMTVLLIFIVLIVVGLKLYRARFGSRKISLDSSGKISYLFHCVIHPADGFGEMRYNKKGSMLIANIMIFLWFFMTVCEFHYRGFIFNSNQSENFNVLTTLAATVGIAFIFCLANWLLSTFFEGKGHLSAVWVNFCYSLMPLIISMGAGILLSRILTLDEGMFMTYLSTVGGGWTLLLIMISSGQLHQYSFKKNIASLICSVAGVAVVIFLFFLFVNLFMQFWEFIKSVVSEYLYRSEVGF